MNKLVVSTLTALSVVIPSVAYADIGSQYYRDLERDNRKTVFCHKLKENVQWVWRHLPGKKLITAADQDTDTETNGYAVMPNGYVYHVIGNHRKYCYFSFVGKLNKEDRNWKSGSVTLFKYENGSLVQFTRSKDGNISRTVFIPFIHKGNNTNQARVQIMCNNWGRRWGREEYKLCVERYGDVFLF